MSGNPFRRSRFAALTTLLAVLVGMSCTAQASAAPADLGSARTLHGFDGTKVKVRPYHVSTVTGDPDFDDPGPGRHFVAVKVSLRNVGRRRVQDAPDNDARLVTRAGRILEPEYLSEECQSGGLITIPRGQTRRVCVAFAVPDEARLRWFEYTLNSGFADDTGQWRVPGNP